MNLEVLRYSFTPIKLNVKKGDKVLILTDSKVDPIIPEALVAAVYYQDGIPMMMIVPPAVAFGNEPPKAAASAILESDILIAACSTAITHTDAVRNGLAKGVRYLAMGGITVESLTQGAATANYEQIHRLSKGISAKLEKCQEVKVYSSVGTELTFSLKDRPAFPLTACIEKPRGIAGFPDGEVATAPVEGTANGTIVIDGGVHHIGRVKDSIILTIKNGRAVEISGGREAESLNAFLRDNGDENSFNLAEFAIGTNPKARLTDNLQEAKKGVGTVHFALGDNLTLGGNTGSRTHLDVLLLKPTVFLDGERVLEDGKLFVEK